MLKIRLARTGKRGQPTYRIVVMEARSSRQGTVVDTIGSYNPALKQDAVVVDKQKYEEWVKKGAQASDAVLRFVLTKAEKVKRWPNIAAKKEEKAEKPEPKAEEPKVEETPAETSTEEVTEAPVAEESAASVAEEVAAPAEEIPAVSAEETPVKE